MPTIREKLPNEPIMIVTLTKDYNFDDEFEASIERGETFMDSLEESVHIIMDFSHFKFDLSSLITGSNLSTRGGNPIFHHPKTLSVSFVTESNIVGLAAKGMDSQPFGNLKVKVFKTVDEALTHVRELA